MKLAAAVLLARGRRAPAAQGAAAVQKPEHESRHPLRQSAALGAAMMVSNFSTIVLYFPAVHAIGISDAAVDAKVRRVRAAVRDHAAPAVGPPLVVTLMGARATPALQRLNGFFTAHRRGIGATICFVFAVLLAVTGLHALR